MNPLRNIDIDFPELSLPPISPSPKKSFNDGFISVTRPIHYNDIYRELIVEFYFDCIHLEKSDMSVRSDDVRSPTHLLGEIKKGNNTAIHVLEMRLSRLLKSLKQSIQILGRNLSEKTDNAVEDNNNIIDYLACIHHLRILYQMIGHARDITHGKGERTLAYMMIYVWHMYFPSLAIYAFHRFVVSTDEGRRPYGSWKDVKYLCEYVNKKPFASSNRESIIQMAIGLANRQLYRDSLAVKSEPPDSFTVKFKGQDSFTVKSEPPDSLSFVAKWIPREHKRFDWLYTKMAIHWSPHIYNEANTSESKHAALSKCKSIYRRVLSRLNKVLNTPQINQCTNSWANIDFECVGARTFDMNKNAFLNVDGSQLPRIKTDACKDRELCAMNYNQFIENKLNYMTEKNGTEYSLDYESNRENVFTGLYVKQAVELLSLRKSLLDREAVSADGIKNIQLQLDLLNRKWRQLSSTFSHIGNQIPLVDMTNLNNNSDALYHAIGFSCLLSEKSNIAKRILFIHHEPIWINLQDCPDFISTIEFIMEHVLVSNYYITMHDECSVMNAFLLLKEAVIHVTRQSTVPNLQFILFSDMHFLKKYPDRSFHKEIISLFSQYDCVPFITYWNIGSSERLYPCHIEDRGVSLFSGNSFSNLRGFIQIMNEKDNTFLYWAKDTYDFMCATIEIDRYSELGDYFDNI